MKGQNGIKIVQYFLNGPFKTFQAATNIKLKKKKTQIELILTQLLILHIYFNKTHLLKLTDFQSRFLSVYSRRKFDYKHYIRNQTLFFMLYSRMKFLKFQDHRKYFVYIKDFGSKLLKTHFQLQYFLGLRWRLGTWVPM